MAPRDLADAKGRFFLMGLVVGLVVGLLRGESHEHRGAALNVTPDPEMLIYVDRAVRIADGRLKEVEVSHAAH